MKSFRIGELHGLRKVLTLVSLTACLHCAAQVIDPVTAAQQPVPGAGHHYLGTGAETVNPADGTVTFVLPIQTPVGRGLSFPFSIHYSEAAPFYILDGQQDETFGWTAWNQYGSPPFSAYGWSYSLPNYVAQANLVATRQASSNLGGTVYYDYCWATQNYRFTGFDGSHGLAAAYKWVDPTSHDPNDTSVCSMGAGVGMYGGYSGNGDDGVYSTQGTMTSIGTGNQPSLTVTDRAGTVFQFPQGPQGPDVSASPSAGGATTFGALAQTITDRNGNQITLNGTSGQAGSYTDTAGRPVVSWTGIGNSTGDQITISGLANSIRVLWTTTTVTLPGGINSVYSSEAGKTCGGTSYAQYTGSAQISVVSEIDLPNGQKYKFTYGDTWGRLTKISFPDGGYVRYHWGTDPLSQGVYHAWVPYGSSGVGYYCLAEIDAAAITDRWVSFDGQTEVLHQSFNYSPGGLPGTQWSSNTNGFIAWTSKATTVTTTDLLTGQQTITKYTYTPVTAGLAGPNDSTWHVANEVPVEQSVVYEDGTGKPLKTVNKTWLDQYAMIGEQTILDNGQGTTTLRCVGSNDHVLASYDYDFQANGSKPADPSSAGCALASGQTTLSGGLNTGAMGPLLQQSSTVYHTFSNAHILDDPDSVMLKDGSGNLISQTNYQYDQFAVLPSGVATGFVSPPGARGNATSVSRWLNTSNSYLTSAYTYFDTGQVQSMTDPCGNSTCSDMLGASHTTYYSYADSWAKGEGPAGNIGNTNAYLTSVTYPATNAAHSESFTWGYADGLMRSHTGQNGGLTTYCYTTSGCTGSTPDPLLRLTETSVTDSAGKTYYSKTNYDYVDAVYDSSSGTGSTVTTTESLSSSQTKKTKITLDGIGHTHCSQLTTDPNGTSSTTTTYDGFGRTYMVSNPAWTSSCPNSLLQGAGITTFGYDALGRKTSQTDSDNLGTQGWQYSANTVTYTDENLNQSKRSTDALGRLTQVQEPNGSSKTPSLTTNYTYDTLGNLISVNQLGVSGTDTPRARTFTYDSLSRLLCAANPENENSNLVASCPASSSTSFTYTYGTTGYAYDANGNVMNKYAPSPNSTTTSGKRISTYYTYDSLNRLIARYSDDWPLTPVSCFQYDRAIGSDSYPVGTKTLSWTQEPACPSTVQTSMPSDAITSTAFLSHDPMGRAWSEQQCTPSSCTTSSKNPYSLNYTFDWAGNLTSYTNGSASTPITFTQGFDAAGHLQTVTSSWSDPTHPANLFTAQTLSTSACSASSQPAYTAWGALQNAAYGNVVTLCRTYDSRLRINQEIDTGIVVSAPTPGSAAILMTGTEQSK